jgi:hypothetical protein
VGDCTESHKIAQDRTALLFDGAFQIDYWRNGCVELRPQLQAAAAPAKRVLVSATIRAAVFPIARRYGQVDL